MCISYLAMFKYYICIYAGIYVFPGMLLCMIRLNQEVFVGCILPDQYKIAFSGPVTQYLMLRS